MSEDGELYKANVTSFILENSLELIVPFHQEVANTEAHTHAHTRVKIKSKIILK